MTARTAEDARFRPVPGDTRRRADGRHTRTVTRATGWAVESHNATARWPEDTLRVESIADWALGGEWGYTYAPKVRTAEDAQYDPLPGDTLQVDGRTIEVVARSRDGMLTVRVGESTDRWAVSVWAAMYPGPWVPA